MAKRKKASVFGEDEKVQVDDEFMKYVREKSAQSKKRIKEDAVGTRNVTEGLMDQIDTVDTSVKKSESKYMDKLLSSKKQRELDKLHAQSIKLRLERRLQGSSEEEIVTEGYSHKRDGYEKADLLAEHEYRMELEDKNASLLGASGVALKVLTSERELETSASPSSFASEKIFNSAKTSFENDVYVNKSIKQRPQVETQDDGLDPLNKRALVKEFLKSNKSEHYIELLKKQYRERQNSH